MPSQLPPGAPIEPSQPIVTPGGRSFWNEAIKIVIAFMAAQILLAGLPFDDWARALLSETGAEISQGQAWWIAAGFVSLALYLTSRSFGRTFGKAPA